MPRKPRFYQPGVPAHVVQRGNNRQTVFFFDDDYQAYLAWLKEGCERHGCFIHAYVLMTNHVHLLVTPDSSDAISRMIQFVGRNYVTYVNHRHGRSGTLWEGRHKGSVIEDETYLLACMRYIELNPVRAGMTKTPEEYPWSSYRDNAFGERSGLLARHRLFMDLGRSEKARQNAYRELFSHALDPEQLHLLRAAVQTGTPLGNRRFRERIERVTGNRVGQLRRGRPWKAAGE
ncbi:MAG: transposase [Chromatiales bacterium]|jgi:putative transposase